jgi:hypothetical protein
MARWQLQCSGKPEEVMCKFCAMRLPDWRNTLFQDVVRANEDVVAVTRHDSDEEEEDTATTSAPLEDAAAPGEIKGDIIVKFNNISFRCQVRTGPEGLADFMRQIRERCGIPEDKMKSLNLTYRCKDPSNGTPMTLEGLNSSAFDAAVLCSAVQDKMKHQSRVNSAVQNPLNSEITSRSSRRLSGEGGRQSCDGRRRSHDGSELVSAFRIGPSTTNTTCILFSHRHSAVATFVVLPFAN